MFARYPIHELIIHPRTRVEFYKGTPHREAFAKAHAALDQTLDAMLASDLYDPLDGAFFRATLTEDWRAFVPEKPLAINALLALTLALGMSWKAGVAAEVIGIPTGSIGEQLQQAKIYLNTPDLFAWTLVIVLVSLVFEKVFLILLKWGERALERM